MDVLLDVLLIVAILGTGIVAGVFYAFSGFVTQGLDRLPPADAARAMREINVTAVRPPLMLAFFGTGLVVLRSSRVRVHRRARGGTWWAIAAAVVYLVGAIGVTAAANVPRNNRLAASGPMRMPLPRRRRGRRSARAGRRGTTCARSRRPRRAWDSCYGLLASRGPAGVER